MKPQTHHSLRFDVYKALGRGNVLHHEPTESNTLGQSGLYTFVLDVIDIVLSSDDERDACIRLHKYLTFFTTKPENDEI